MYSFGIVLVKSHRKASKGPSAALAATAAVRAVTATVQCRGVVKTMANGRTEQVFAMTVFKTSSSLKIGYPKRKRIIFQPLTRYLGK